MNAGAWAKQGGGSYSFKNGHMLLWTNWSNPEDRPMYAKRPEWIEKFGEARADWMLRKSRNLCLYPNVYLMDQFSSQIRVVPTEKNVARVQAASSAASTGRVVHGTGPSSNVRTTSIGASSGAALGWRLMAP